MNFLGIDIGTQGIRAIVSDEKGNIISEAHSSFNSINIVDRPEFKEQDPDVWIYTLVKVINGCVLNLSNEKIDAVSLDATSGTVLALDKDNKPLTNGIMYNDSRAKEEAEIIRLQSEEHQNKHGYIFNASYGLPKIYWVKNNLSDIYNNTYKFVHQSDYIYGFLTGNYSISDYSNALKTGFDLIDENWNEYIFNFIDKTKLPDVVAPGTKIGTVNSNASEILGLSEGTEVYAGATDGYTSSLAAGLSNPGQWATVIGTTMVLKGITNKLVLDEQGRIYSHKHPQGWWMPGGASNVGGHYLNQIADKSNFDELNKSVPDLTPTGEICYPNITTGERFPFVALDAAGFNTSDNKDIAIQYTAAMEGVGYTERLSYEMLKNLGCEINDTILTSGGACKSDEWLQIRANILNKTLKVPQSTDAAMGSAMIAASGKLGITLEDAVNNMLHIAKIIEPQNDRVNNYNEFYEKFKEKLRERSYI